MWYRALILVILCAVSAAAFADVWYVDKDNNGPQDGLSWASAFKTIQPAIDAAFGDGGGDVWVRQGVYDEERSGTSSDGALVMRAGVALCGGFDGTESAIDERSVSDNPTSIVGSTSRGGSPAYHVVVAADAILDGFTISGGHANGGTWDTQCGGGIFAYHITAVIRNCTVSGNQAQTGAGICYTDCPASTLTDCTLAGNTVTVEFADNGGGGVAAQQTDLTLTRCVFNNNTAPSGAGLFIWGPATGAATQCTFAGNNSTAATQQHGGGGGVYLRDTGSSVFDTCTFQSNSTTQYGGGLYDYLCMATTIRNCEFGSNSAAKNGGALAGGNVSGIPLTCIDSKFRLNTASSGGAASICGNVARCSFTENSCTTGPGGAVIAGELANFRDCIFGYNLSLGTSPLESHGGAVYLKGCMYNSFDNCVFAHNYANGTGGACYASYTYNPSSPISFTNCTFTQNEAVVDGGAANNEGMNPFVFKNSILYDNTAGGAGDQLAASGPDKITATYCNIQGGFAGTGNLDVDPLFEPSVTMEFALQSGSPCIDGGDPAGVPPAPDTDILGVSRANNLPVDMGAYEYDRLPAATVTAVTASPTSGDEIQFTVVFSEAVSGFDSGDDLQVDVTDSAGYLSATVTATSASEYDVVLTDVTGSGSISVAVDLTSDVADLAGQAMLSSNSATIVVDHTAPSVQTSGVTGSPAANSQTVDFSLTFTEAVQQVTPGDFAPVTSGTVEEEPSVTGVSGNGATWIVTVDTGRMEGLLGVEITDTKSGITDVVGNPLPAGGGTGLVHAVDTLGPRVTITRDGGSTTPGARAAWNLVFSEAVGDSFTLASIAPLSGSLSGDFIVEGSGQQFTVAWDADAPYANGTIGFRISAGGAADALGNESLAVDSPVTGVYPWLGFDPQPEDEQLYEGDSCTLTTGVAVGSPFETTYQWRKSACGSVTPGPAAATWVIDNATDTDAGDYWCEAGYGAQTYESNTATVTVRPHLTIEEGPADQEAALGGDCTFSVTATGGYEPLTYAWTRNGTSIEGATEATYTRQNIRAIDTGTYSVTVSDALTESESASAQLSLTQEMPAAAPLGLAVTALAVALAGLAKRGRKD